MIDTTGFRIDNAGHSIPVYAWLPPSADAAILILHGMAEHASRYDPVARLLAAEGFAVYAHDQHAHGSAAPSVKEQGLAEKEWFQKAVIDTDHVLHEIKKRHNGKKIFLLGHSMGSFLAQRYFQWKGSYIDGLILSATNGKRDPLLGMGIFVSGLQMQLMGHRHRSKLLNLLSFGRFNKPFRPNRTAFDWLSRDDKEVDTYIADEQCGWVASSTFFHYFFKGLEEMFDKRNINNIPADIPVYAFAGDRDPVGMEGKGFMELVKKWEAAGNHHITYKLYPGGRHEMLNETNRHEVVSNLVKWTRNQL